MLYRQACVFVFLCTQLVDWINPKDDTPGCTKEACGFREMYGKKTIGVIRSTVWVGPDGKVKKHWKKVPKAAAHPEKVLQALLQDA